MGGEPGQRHGDGDRREGVEQAFEKPAGVRPTTLALAPDGSVWVANQDEATVWVLDGQEGSLLQMIKLPRASRPHGVVFSPDGGAAYVSLQGTGQLLKLDPIGRVVLDSLDVGLTPRGLAVTADSAKVLVTRFISAGTRGG